MDVENPQFAQYEARFRQLADRVERLKGADPAIASAKYLLCLYGENGLSPEDEFEMLARLEGYADDGLKCAEVETYYWEDLVLYVP